MVLITELVRSKGPNVMFLMETNWSIVEMRRLCFDLNFQSVMAVLCDGRSGGLSMFLESRLQPTHSDLLAETH